MPVTLEILVALDSVGETKPYTFSMVNQLTELGTGFTLTGTPAVECWPVDGGLVLGTPVFNSPPTMIQVPITATAQGIGSRYYLDAHCQATNGTATYTVIVRGILDVSPTR